MSEGAGKEAWMDGMWEWDLARPGSGILIWRENEPMSLSVEDD